MQLTRLRLFAATLATAATVALGACADGPTVSRPTLLLGSGDPNLLECPVNTTESTTGVIGPLGGAITLGNHKVEIPGGAVSEPTLFSLTVPQGRYMKVDVSAVGVEHYVFGAPISVTMDYARCPAGRTAGRTLEVWYVAPVTNAPLENKGGVNDPANRRITFQTGHLSGYVIAY
jgi:hypothetical protein